MLKISDCPALSLKNVPKRIKNIPNPTPDRSPGSHQSVAKIAINGDAAPQLRLEDSTTNTHKTGIIFTLNVKMVISELAGFNGKKLIHIILNFFRDQFETFGKP